MISKKRQKVLARRKYLQATKAQENAQKAVEQAAFAEANPTPILLKERSVRFRNKVQAVEQIPSQLSDPRLQAREITRLRNMLDVFSQDPQVMEAVERRKRCNRPNS